MKTQILRYAEIQDQKTHKLEVRGSATESNTDVISDEDFQLMGLLSEGDTAFLMTKAAREMQALVKREIVYDISEVEIECFAGQCKFKNPYSAITVIFNQYKVDVLGEAPENPGLKELKKSGTDEEREMMKQMIRKGDDDMRQMIEANNKLLAAHKNLEREYLLQKGNLELLVVQNKEFLERIQAFEEGQKSLDKFKPTPSTSRTSVAAVTGVGKIVEANNEVH